MNLVFDLDDTIFDTRNYLIKHIEAKYGFQCNAGDDLLSDENSGGHLRKVLKDGRYMEQVPLRQGFEHFGEWLTALRSELPALRIYACSHRGFHLHGLTYTKRSLQNNGITFDGLYLCDMEVMPNKLKYLRLMFNGRLMLIDDNPHRDIHMDDEVVLVDQPWNQHFQIEPERRVKTLDDILSILPVAYLSVQN